MPGSVYRFLREMLSDALVRSFPETAKLRIDIPLTTISPDPQTDISTPFLLRLTETLPVPIDIFKKPIIDSIAWNPDFIEDNARSVYKNGFLNFRLSDMYLRRAAFDEGCTINTVIEKRSGDNFLHSINGIATRFRSTYTPLSFENLQWELLSSVEEHSVMRTLALSIPDGLRTQNSIRYFYSRLRSETELLYHRQPVFCKSQQLTTLRLLLINATVNRLNILLNEVK